VAPGQMGGHKPRAIAGEHHTFLVQRIREGEFTLRGLVAKLAKRGLKISSTVGIRCSLLAVATRTWLAGGLKYSASEASIRDL
jgi:hypothetical protein